MRHYTWNGSGGPNAVDESPISSIPNATTGVRTPLGTGVQPNNYDIDFNLNAAYPHTAFGASKGRVELTENSEGLAEMRRLKGERKEKEGRIATLVAGTGRNGSN